MAGNNSLGVSLGGPSPDFKHHRRVDVSHGNIEKALNISFQRTIRVTYALPPGLGEFPLFNVKSYADTLPESMALKGGLFMPIHDRESLYINFESIRPFAVQVYVGGVNAISGEPMIENIATTIGGRYCLIRAIQDYVVVDSGKGGQLWLDGIAKVNGKVMQFVSVKSGVSYSVESQVTGQDYVGGIQNAMTPIKWCADGTITVKQLNGQSHAFRINYDQTVYELLKLISQRLKVPVIQMRLLFNKTRLFWSRPLYFYGIKDASTLNLVIKLSGGGLIKNCVPDDGEMGLGVGGLIQQLILLDPYPSHIWDRENTSTFITGFVAPPSPVTVAAYAAAGLPFFAIPKEKSSGVAGSFSDVLSVAQLDLRKGIPSKAALKKKLDLRIIQLDTDGEVPIFKSVEELTNQVKKMGIVELD